MKEYVMSVIFCLVGHMGAGKSSATYYLHHVYGARFRKFSDPIQAMVRFCGLEVSRKNLQETVEYLHERFGRNYLGTMMLSAITAYGGPIMVCDGIRIWEDLALLRERVPGLVLVAIDAPLAVRFERRKSDPQYEDEKELTLEEFEKRHLHPHEAMISKIMELADYRINNAGPIEDLYRDLDLVVKEVLTRQKMLKS